MTNRRSGSRLRQDILRYLLNRERSSDSTIPGLNEIADSLGVPKEDINDQLDILESQGAITSNRTSTDAAPVLTGIGKALLEEMEEGSESLSYKKVVEVGKDDSPGVEQEIQWDAFICHASEDKDMFVRQLANELTNQGARIWYDEFTLRIGDSLRRSIDKGLAKSRYGIVVLSHAFFVKKWPQTELDGLVVREQDGRKVILPVWFNVSVEDVTKYSLPLADRVAAKVSDGLDRVVADLLSILHPNSSLKQEDMSKPDRELKKIGGETPKANQSAESTLPHEPHYKFSGTGPSATRSFAVQSSPWKLQYKTNWKGHFAVRLQGKRIELVINRGVSANRLYETYVHNQVGDLHFFIQEAPPDGDWTLIVVPEEK